MTSTVKRTHRQLEQCAACDGWVGQNLWVDYGQKCPLCGKKRKVQS